MQDVQIGLVMGILPILAGHYEHSKTSFALLPNHGIVHYWLHGASHAGSKGRSLIAFLSIMKHRSLNFSTAFLFDV